MKSILSVFLLLILFNNKGLCENNIYFNFDYAVFHGESGKSILEVYYSVNLKTLKLIKNENNYEAAIKIDIIIRDAADDKIIYSNTFKSPSELSDTNDEKIKQKLIGQVNYVLPNGSYKLNITGSDFNDSARKDIYEQDIKVENNESEIIKLSDIELSTLITKSQNDKSPFYKNTLEIIPNPSNLFGMNLNEIYYYFELYGLTEKNISDVFKLNYSITDLNNKNVISFSKNIKRNNESKADYGKIKIDSLERGSYIFTVYLTDTLKNININAEKKFFIYNNNTGVKTSDSQNEFLKSEFAAMPEKEVEDEFAKMTYIITEQERKRFNNLNALNDKRNFLYLFWKEKDMNPETRNLETKDKYFKRVNEANRLYKEAYKEGWKSDRGRIFIIYGKPDDVDKHVFESQTKNYEVWKYNSVEGGGECVFIENQPSTGVYWLVHSTFRNELKNENWQNELKIR